MNSLARAESIHSPGLEPLLRRIIPNDAPADRASKFAELLEAYRNGIVVKVGWEALSGQSDKVFQSVGILSRLGVPLVVVHGGGNQVSREMERRGMTVEMIDGLRVTTSEALAVIMAVMSRIGADITYRLNSNGIGAVQLLGHDGLLEARQISAEKGLIGKVTSVDSELILKLIAEGMVPVVTPGALSASQYMNINADHAAAGVASGIGAAKAVFVTNVDGIYDGSAFRHEITVDELKALMATGTINGGMMPKADSAIIAVESGVSAGIVNGQIRDSVILHLAEEWPEQEA